MRLRLRFFGHLSEAITDSPIDFEVEAGTAVIGLRRAVAELHPDLSGRLDRCMIAVNTEFADADQILAEGDEVAFLPPVSGG